MKVITYNYFQMMEEQQALSANNYVERRERKDRIDMQS